MTARPTRRAVLLGAGAIVAAQAAPAAADDVGVLNGLLKLEHAAIYDLGAAGATLSLSARARVLRDFDEHRARRDALTERVTALGGKPVAALAAYADPAPGADPLADLLAVEQAAAHAYHVAVGVVVDKTARKLCADAFVAEARHLAISRAALRMAGAPSAFVTGA